MGSNDREKMILLLEDNDNIIFTLKNMAERLEYTIAQTQKFTTADYLIENRPKLESFNFLIVDLSIPGNYEGYFTVDETEELNRLSGNIRLSGWIWLKRFLKIHPEVKGKLIVLSAYLHYLPESEKEKYKQDVIFLDKTPPETIVELNRLLSR